MRNAALCALLLAGCTVLQPASKPTVPIIDISGKTLLVTESESEEIKPPKRNINGELKKLLERVKETPKGLFLVFDDDHNILITTRNYEDMLVHEQQHVPIKKVSKMYDSLPYGSLNKFESCLQTHVKDPLTRVPLLDYCHEVSIESFERLKFEMTVEIQLNALEMYDALDCTGYGVKVENGIYGCL